MTTPAPKTPTTTGPARVRIVSDGPTGAGTRVEGMGDLPISRIEVLPITRDELNRVRLEVVGVELDIAAQVDPSTPAAASVAAALAVDVARLRVRPGDVVVVTTRDTLPVQKIAALRSQVADLLPSGTSVLVLDAGMGLAVLAPDQLKRTDG